MQPFHAATLTFITPMLLTIACTHAEAQINSGSTFPTDCAQSPLFQRLDLQGQIFACVGSNPTTWTAITWPGPEYTQAPPQGATPAAAPGTQPTTKIAPYSLTALSYPAGAACCLQNGDGAGVWTMMQGAPWRIRMTGTLNRVRFAWAPTTCAYTGITIQIWRKDTSAGYDLVAESENLLSRLTPGAINDLTLNTPLQVQAGDYYGTGEAGTGPANCGAFDLISDTGVNAAYTTGAKPNALQASFGGAINSKGIIIELYSSTRPLLVEIGDSLISGYPGNADYCDSFGGIAGAGPATSIGSTIAAAMNWNTIECGISANTTDQELARFESDVLAANPAVVLIEGGVNDFNVSGSTEAHVLSNLTSMAAQAAGQGSKVILLAELPGAYSNATTMGKRDQLSIDLAALALSRGYTFVDAGPYIGMTQAGGPVGNIWSSLPQYDAGDHLHLLPAGYARVGQAIVDALTGTERR